MTIEIFSSSPSLSPEATPDHVAEPLVSVVIVTWNRKECAVKLAITAQPIASEGRAEGG